MARDQVWWSDTSRPSAWVFTLLVVVCTSASRELAEAQATCRDCKQVTASQSQCA